MSDTDIYHFICESNRIEGIIGVPPDREIAEFKRFMALETVMLDDLKQFVSVYQPNAKLRTEKGMDVRVGDHYPPPGGGRILALIGNLLGEVNAGEISPWQAHIDYETIHPFTDGNGRSGRMLWAWMMQDIRLTFLHRFYYQTLSNVR